MTRLIETAIVLVIIVALAFALSGCTSTRGPCTASKEVKYVVACEEGGRMIHIDPFFP